MNKKLLNLLLAVTMLAVLVPTALAAPTAQGQDYVVVADDWLSKLADKYLGNPMAYPAIVEYTNQKHAEDASYAEITDPDLIEVGWKIYIPSAEEASGFVAAAIPPTEPKAIVVQLGANDPRSIDPQQAIDSRDWTLLAQLFPSLVIMDAETYEIKPGMAKSWEISEDGLVYTFHLIEGVPWVRYNPDTGAVEQVQDENGDVRYVTAQDFVYGFLRALDPETGSPAAYILAPYIVGGSEFNSGEGSREDVAVEAVDDYTFQVTAPEKIGYALGIYSIINAHATPQWAIEESGEAWTEPESINVFGPFALKEWVHESEMTFVKNPFWPGSEGVQQAKLDEITFRFIDEVVGLREYEAGNLHVTLVPGDQIERVRVDSELGSQLKIVPWVCTQAWGFHTQKPPFDNVHIRRAFNYAVDRETLVKDVLAGGEIPAPFFTPSSIALAPSATDIGDLGIRFDSDKAQEELKLGLEELGLSSVDELPSITVEFGTSAILSAVAQALQAMWLETLGVRVELSQIDNTVYWAKQEEDAGQVFRAGWCPDYNDANNYLRDVYRSDSIYNYGKWNNPEYDTLVDEARVETNPAKRLELYTKAEQILNVEDAGTMTLYYPVRAQLTQPNVKRTYALSGTEYFWDWDIVE
jgi:oligopeptide transport system substrate-binding protein